MLWGGHARVKADWEFMQLQADWPRLEFWGRAIQHMLTLLGTCVFGCLWAAPAVEGGAFMFDLNDVKFRSA